MCHSYCILPVMHNFPCSITREVTHDHLFKVVSARLLQYKVIHSLFVSSVFVGRNFKTMHPVSHHPLTQLALACISVSWLNYYYHDCQMVREFLHSFSIHQLAFHCKEKLLPLLFHSFIHISMGAWIPIFNEF